MGYDNELKLNLFNTEIPFGLIDFYLKHDSEYVTMRERNTNNTLVLLAFFVLSFLSKNVVGFFTFFRTTKEMTNQ